MDETRLCISCGAELGGPFRPSTSLTWEPAEEASQEKPLALVAWAWICPGCGLVHWYSDDDSLARGPAAADDGEALSAQPDTSYERRTQMLRMLRRVRRM